MKKYKTTVGKTAKTVADFRVHRSIKSKDVPLLTAQVVPAGVYRSEIISVDDALCNNGKPAGDVTYLFTDDEGMSAEAKIRYPLAGYHIGILSEALLNAGLPEGAPLVDAVGIQEEVSIMYPYDGALGKIQTRRPLSTAGYSQGVNKKRPSLAPVSTKAVPPKNSNHDDEDEFDDFIEDDEELDDA